MKEPKTKEMTLSSTYEEIERVNEIARDLQEWADLNEDQFDTVLLTLSEAVTNAILHGNKIDPSKKVQVKAHLDDETLSISVKDEGEGFDPNDLPDPLQEENILNEGGRGVFIIEQFAEEVNFSENGTKITMTFNLNNGSA